MSEKIHKHILQFWRPKKARETASLFIKSEAAAIYRVLFVEKSIDPYYPGAEVVDVKSYLRLWVQ